MHVSRWWSSVALLVSSAGLGTAEPLIRRPACRAAVVEGELNAGREFSRLIGNGLRLWFQPIASGWILRVVPATGPVGEHDYAELATPPYRSVNPLSLSTDFSLRAQDAVGWNPRRFRFATTRANFERLNNAYTQLIAAGSAPPAAVEGELSERLAEAVEGKLTIIDAKLVPGMADQWRTAAAVSSRFTSTAHTLVQPSDPKLDALGKLVWVRFRVDLDVPSGFHVTRGIAVVPYICGNL